MKIKTNNQKRRTHKNKRGAGIRIILIIIATLSAIGAVYSLIAPASFAANLQFATHKLAECLRQKCDQIIEIIVIIGLATLKWFAERFRD